MVCTFETEYIGISKYVSCENRKPFDHILCSRVQGVKYETEAGYKITKIQNCM
jgi:hypothetical protein